MDLIMLNWRRGLSSDFGFGDAGVLLCFSVFWFYLCQLVHYWSFCYDNYNSVF
jgi:hypothetical protein